MRHKVAVLALVAVVLGGCSSGQESEQPHESASPTPETLTIAGQLAVEADVSANLQAGYNDQGGTCLTPGGYDDMHDGAQVKVLNGAGDVLKAGTLDAYGLDVPNGSTSMTDAFCRFDFEVTGVPAGEAVYQVEIGSRDPYAIPDNDDPENLKIELGDVPAGALG